MSTEQNVSDQCRRKKSDDNSWNWSSGTGQGGRKTRNRKTHQLPMGSNPGILTRYSIQTNNPAAPLGEEIYRNDTERSSNAQERLVQWLIYIAGDGLGYDLGFGFLSCTKIGSRDPSPSPCSVKCFA